MPRTAAVLGAVLAVAVLAGCGPSTPTAPPSSNSPSAGAAPSSVSGAPSGEAQPAPGAPELASPPGQAPPGTRAVPVYYLGHTAAGDRLYREFHQVRVAGADDLGSAAVRELLAHPAGVDPNYRSAWPTGWTLRAPVRRTAGVITVDLTEPKGGGSRPDASRAGWATRQLVYTVQGALGATDPVRVLVDGRQVRQLWGTVAVDQPLTRGDPYTSRSLVQIDNPGNGVTLGRSFQVSGEAAVFEATVLWEVRSGTTVVRHGFTTTAEGQKFSPYSFSLTLEPGSYTLRVYEDDPSGGQGGAPDSDSKSITVR